MKLHPDAKSIRLDLNKKKVYLAGPFFSPTQIAFIEFLEKAIVEAGFELFSPRKPPAALEMNACVMEKLAPSDDLRLRVFSDNVVNIEDADLMVAVIDDRDTGTVWEMGFAAALSVPIVTVTNHTYGMNLMLAQTIVGHAKGQEDIKEMLRLAAILEKEPDDPHYIEFKQKFGSSVALKEGPTERSQSRSEMVK